MREVINDEEIEAAFNGTNFGPVEPRKLLEQAALKRIRGYHSGYTLTRIMRILDITNERDTLTRKGKHFVFAAFYDESHS